MEEIGFVSIAISVEVIVGVGLVPYPSSVR